MHTREKSFPFRIKFTRSTGRHKRDVFCDHFRLLFVINSMLTAPICKHHPTTLLKVLYAGKKLWRKKKKKKERNDSLYLAETSHRVDIFFAGEDAQATPGGLCLVHISDNSTPRGCSEEEMTQDACYNRSGREMWKLATSKPPLTKHWN